MKSFLRFFRTYLEPDERLSEVFFGLIMVLSITRSVNLLMQGEDTVGDLLKAAIGCNTAWGLVDGVLYILNSLMRRSQKLRIIQNVRKSKDFQEAFPWIANRLDSLMTPLIDAGDKDRLYEAIYKKLSQVPLESGRLLKEDILGAVATFFLVFLSTFPVTIPFMILRDPALALRTSDLIGLISLFIVGYRWGHFAMVKPLRPAFGMMLIGALMIGLTIALGG